MFNQIPRSLMPHSATYKKLTGLDAWGKKTYATSVTLNYIRIERAKKNALTALGEQKNDSLVLFFDCVNSLPVGTSFSPGDVITFGTQDYTVREQVDEYTVYGTPHHYEVALV